MEGGRLDVEWCESGSSRCPPAGETEGRMARKKVIEGAKNKEWVRGGGITKGAPKSNGGRGGRGKDLPR